MHIIPNTIVDAFAKGDILQVLVVSLLFGFALFVVRHALQTSDGNLEQLYASSFRSGSDSDALCAHRRFWSDGLYRGQIWFGFARTVGKVGWYSLWYRNIFRGHYSRGHRPARRLSDTSLAVVPAGRNSAGAGHQFFRTRIAESHAQTRKSGMLSGTCRFGGAHRLHLQCRRNQFIHDAGGAVRRASDPNTADTCRNNSQYWGSRCSLPKARAECRARHSLRWWPP